FQQPEHRDESAGLHHPDYLHPDGYFRYLRHERGSSALCQFLVPCWSGSWIDGHCLCDSEKKADDLTASLYGGLQKSCGKLPAAFCFFGKKKKPTGDSVGLLLLD